VDTASGQVSGYLVVGKGQVAEPGSELEPPAGGLEEFCRGLAKLRAAAELTVRELEKRSGYSKAALSKAASGRSLPSFDLTMAYVGACGGNVQAWEQRWRELRAALDAAASTASRPQEYSTPEAVEEKVAEAGAAEATVGGLDPAADPPTAQHGPDAAGERPVGEGEGEALPAEAGGALVGRCEEGGERSGQAAGRTVVRVKLSAVPLILAVAVIIAVVLASRPSATQLSPPEPGTGTAAPASAPALPPSPSFGTPSAVPSHSAGEGGGLAAGPPADHGAGSPIPSSTPIISRTTAVRGSGTGATAITWTGYSGTQCASPGAAAAVFSPAGGWDTTTGGAYSGGCKAARYHHLSGRSSPDSTADWVFTPSAGITGCTFALHIPAGTWTDSAQYQLYGAGGTQTASFTVDQHAYDAGGWYTTSRYPTTGGTVDLQLTNAGSGRYGVVADIVTATCS
jgi:transcriptional regulator with XRE-family HTH domain